MLWWVQGRSMGFSKRRPFVVAVVLSMLALVSGCAGAPASTQPAQAPQGAQPSAGQEKQPQTLAELANYDGADREQRLYGEAKKIGTIWYYTSIRGEDVAVFQAAFEKKYPGLKLQVYRADGDLIMQKILTEAQAGHSRFDVVENGSVQTEVLKREKATGPFTSPHVKEQANGLGDPDKYWYAVRVNYFVAGYNTNIVKDPPKTYEDLLKPEYKGKMAIEATDFDWLMGIYGIFGDAKANTFIEQLAKQDLEVRKGHSLMAQLVAAGEVPIALTLYVHNVGAQMKSGAPVKWIFLEPVLGRSNSVSVAAKPPNPGGALLLADFLLSREGQALYAKQSYVPANTGVETDPPGMNKGFTVHQISASQFSDHAKEWEKLYAELLVSKSKTR